MSAPGLYVHVPFCSSVCPYCDFAVTVAGAERRQAYVDALRLEIELVVEPWTGCDTLYFGGGTPSALTDDQLGTVIEALRGRGFLAPAAHISLEANPDDVSVARAAAWRRLGVATVSVGVQSFSDVVLARLGRRHRRSQAIAALDALKAAGITTVAADLIFGVADQDAAAWRQELATAVALGIDHLSCYQLTVHPDTLLGRRVARGAKATVGEELQAELFVSGWRQLAAAGYHGYEVSNFAAAPAHRSRHNQKYWDHTPYLGLGPAAHSFDGRRRWWNERRLRRWQHALSQGRRPLAGDEELSDRDLLLETVMLRLRTAAGLDLAAVRARFGVDLLAVNRALVERLVADGRLDLVGEVLRPTAAGLAVADGLAAGLRLGHE